MNRLIARFEMAAIVFVCGAVGVSHIAAQPGKPVGKIVYNAIVAEDAPEQLRILDTANNQVTVVPLQGFRVVREPVWFPSGDRIAFHANVGFSSAQIYTVRPDGNSLCQLTSGFGDFVTPTIPISAERIFFQGVSGDIFSIGSLCGSQDLQTYPVRCSSRPSHLSWWIGREVIERSAHCPILLSTPSKSLPLDGRLPRPLPGIHCALHLAFIPKPGLASLPRLSRNPISLAPV